MIPEIKKVLFATDLSGNARHAFRYAAGEAARHGACMVLLHVLEKAPGSIRQQIESLFGEERLREMEQSEERSARDVLIGKSTDLDIIRGALADFCNAAKAKDALFSFESQEILIKEGKVAEEILATAAEVGCDFIVLGAHKGLLGKTALGGVARAVLHGTKIPVLIVPPPETL